MAQQDSSRSTRGGSVNHVYQEKQLDEQVRRYVYVKADIGGACHAATAVAAAVCTAAAALSCISIVRQSMKMVALPYAAGDLCVTNVDENTFLSFARQAGRLLHAGPNN